MRDQAAAGERPAVTPELDPAVIKAELAETAARLAKARRALLEGDAGDKARHSAATLRHRLALLRSELTIVLKIKRRRAKAARHNSEGRTP